MKFLHVISFAFIYLWEVIHSTVTLARLVLAPKLDIHPNFVKVPLTLKGDFSRFLFACLVSMTPGSLSVLLDAERSVLLVHLLDARDPEASVTQIKARIETPLLKIFGH